MSAPLRRILGPTTALLIGLGVAIGSGIFRTPSLVAGELGAPGYILLAWSLGGVFVLASGMLSAELATRYPRAGGEYVYLREAYGDFVAFFFGWGYTVFIVGGGAATIAAAFGEALAELMGLGPTAAGPLGVLGIGAVTLVNVVGLSAGAGLQNGLTLLKVVALVVVAGLAFTLGEASPRLTDPLRLPEGRGLLAAWIAVLPPVLWAYGGTTDAVKMAEEIDDVQRGLPRALIGSALALTLLYVGVNAAYLAVLTPEELAGTRFAASAAMERLFGPAGHRAVLGLSLVVFLGALSSTVLATVRVTFALARDGLAFSALARMSASQSPVPALLVLAVIASAFTLLRDFSQILDIYFLAAAVLFGLAYGTLFVFRARDKKGSGPPPGIFRCPAGPAVATFLITVQVAMAALIIYENPRDSAYTLGLLGAFAGLYFVWRGLMPHGAPRP